MSAIVDWRCPICGHNSYSEIETDEFVTEVNITSEGHLADTTKENLPLGFECDGCTVTFGNPQKFNVNAANFTNRTTEL
jgi:rubredoxin